ncbi:jg12230, partial [Pararge aegeria aegeria]
SKTEAANSPGSNPEDEEPKEAWMRAPAGGVAVKSGEDALLTCVVLGARGKPVLWKRARDLKVLTAGAVRVTRDERIQVLHDDSEEPLQGPGIKKGGDVWALVIKSVKPTDTGLYMCELNTEPPVRSFHKLTANQRDVREKLAQKKFRKMKDHLRSPTRLPSVVITDKKSTAELITAISPAVDVFRLLMNSNRCILVTASVYI